MALARAWTLAAMRRAWTGLVFIGMVAGLGGAVVLTAVIGAQRTRTALERAVGTADSPSAHVQSDDPATVAALATMPGVRTVIPLEIYPGSVDGVDGDVSLTAVPPEFGRQINRVDIDAGRLPAPEATDEALVTPYLATVTGLRVGDHFVFHGVSPEQLSAFISSEGPSGEELPVPDDLTLVVVGIGDDLVGNLTDPGVNVGALVSSAFTDRHGGALGHFGGDTGLGGWGYVWIEGGAPALDAVRAATRIATPDLTIDSFAGIAEPLVRTNHTLAVGTLVFAVAAGLALIAGIGAALSRQATRRANDLEVMAAMGAHRRMVTGLLVAEIAPAALLGGAVASAGVAAFASVTPFGEKARGIDPSRGAVPGLVVLTICFALVAAAVLLIASVTALWRTRAITSRQRAGHPGRTAWAGGSPTFATGVRFALTRSAGSFAARPALVAGIFGVAGVAGGLVYAANLHDLEAAPERWGWTWSLLLESYDGGASEAQAIATVGADVAGVAVLRDVQARVSGIDTRAVSFEVLDGSIGLALSSGRLPQSPDEVVLGVGLARRLGLHEGDTVSASSSDGDVALTVVGEARVYPTDDDQLADPAILLTPEGQQRVALSDGFGKIAIRAAEGVRADTLYQRFAEVIGTDAMTPAVYALARPPTEVANVTQLRPIGFALAAFLGLLAMALVASVLVGTPKRRGSELAVLRALGMRPRQAGSIIGWQALTVAVVSIAVGVPLGLIASRLAFSRVAHDAFVDPDPFAIWPTLVVVVPATLVVALVLALRPARRAAVLPLASTIRAE